jgi:hypothetical protein
MAYSEGVRYGNERKARSKQLTPQVMVFVEKLIVGYLFKRLAVIYGT